MISSNKAERIIKVILFVENEVADYSYSKVKFAKMWREFLLENIEKRRKFVFE